VKTFSRSAPEIFAHAGDRLAPFTPPRQARPFFASFLGSTTMRRVSLALLLPVPWVRLFFLTALVGDVDLQTRQTTRLKSNGPIWEPVYTSLPALPIVYTLYFLFIL
jgi:hypothetical protein